MITPYLKREEHIANLMAQTKAVPGFFTKQPNFLILMCDQERYPPCYEDSEVRKWRERYLPAQNFLRQNGLEFHRHYTGSTACCPARGTFFTGQYPSLHGVSQTDGVAKGPFDPDMFWLDPNTVPTMGDYFRVAGYRTFYKGKWHISEADLIIPGTHNSLPSYQPATGVPDPAHEALYLQAERLEQFGFSGWIGPEPHGPQPHNSGSSARNGVSGRDPVFADQVVNLLDQLERDHHSEPETPPWLLVASFVNPHDIAIFGLLSRISPQFEFKVDDTIPDIPPPPTYRQPFDTRPRCQLSYRRTLGQAIQPVVETPFYRRLYYQLQKNVDQEMQRVLAKLKNSSFYEDTIVIFTADHGELLGAHGGMIQKWHCAFEEVVHVPLVLSNPHLFQEPKSAWLLTSHLDILPTMLGLAGIDPEEAAGKLKAGHSEVHPPVGRDLAPLVLAGSNPEELGEPLYFMTDDEITQGLDQHNFIGWHYNSVLQPNHLETIITDLPSEQGLMLWKYSRYFDNPQFWSNPGKEDELMPEFGKRSQAWAGIKAEVCTTVKKTQPVPEEYELYNLTADPLEEINLAAPGYATPESRKIQIKLTRLLEEQSRQKRLTPTSGTVAGVR